MATTATFPPTHRRPDYQPITGRASYPEIYYLKKIDNSRLRREVDPRKRRECFSLLGLGILVFIFSFLYAWQHFQSVRYSYEIQRLRSEAAALENWNHQMRVEHAQLASPMRIEALARKELGLEPAMAQQVIQVGAVNPGSGVQDSELAGNLNSKIPGE
ncbi:MAG: cell division protein FtsL [Acidobacteria bacterium]|nr:cell division protein FtsL [Acidobacteriota bacterium]